MVKHIELIDNPYVSLREAVAEAVSMSRSSSRTMADLITYQIQKTGLEEELAAIGLRGFKPLAAGTSGIVVELPDHQVMRICYNMNGFNKGAKPVDIRDVRPNALQQLHSIHTATSKNDGNLIYEIMPKLPQRTGVSEALKRMMEAVKPFFNGYKMADNIEVDVGYLPDETACFLDPDILKSGQSYLYHPLRDKEWVIDAPNQKSRCFSYLPEGILSKQEAAFPALLDGRIRGVLSDEDRMRLERGELETLQAEKPECLVGVTKKTLSEFIHHVFDEKLYPSQAMECMGIVKNTVDSLRALDGRVVMFNGVVKN